MIIGKLEFPIELCLGTLFNCYKHEMYTVKVSHIQCMYCIEVMVEDSILRITNRVNGVITYKTKVRFY